jgi:hypothetical protein
VLLRALCVLAMIMLAAPIGSRVTRAQTPDVDAVRAASDAFLKAYGRGSSIEGRTSAYAEPRGLATDDFASLIDQFDERATYAGTLQPFWIRGRAEIADLWARYFARYADRRMIFRDRNFQVFENASVETGYAEMYMGDDARSSVPTFMRYSITRIRQNNAWKIVTMMVDRLPSDQPPAGVMPPWANTLPRGTTPR